MNPHLAIARSRLREHVAHDLGMLKAPIATGLYGLLRSRLQSSRVQTRANAYRTLMRLHSGNFSAAVDRQITGLIARAMRQEQDGTATGLWQLFDDTVAGAATQFRLGARPDPARLVGSRMLVVKRWRPEEPGVLLVDYSYVFPLLAGLFDLDRIAARYTMVLEPSWAGTCSPDILLYSRLPHRVFVETIEPRDRDFLTALGTNLRPVPLAANWWVDPGPPPAAHTRDIDVAMVAAWADIKRHWRVFRALASLRQQGHRLSVALIGYQHDRSRADIERLADHFGIRDQVQTHERLSPADVSKLLARSKVHVLWSRRECANRAIIEAMLADVPVIVREGLTFGFPYPYINAQTGRFVSERALEPALLEMVRHRDDYSPRRWVLNHMTCELATRTLERHLEDDARQRGLPWTEGLVVRTSTLDTQRYLHPDDRSRFDADYAFLHEAIR